jgi:hypothetical protein
MHCTLYALHSSKVSYSLCTVLPMHSIHLAKLDEKTRNKLRWKLKKARMKTVAVALARSLKKAAQHDERPALIAFYRCHCPERIEFAGFLRNELVQAKGIPSWGEGWKVDEANDARLCSAGCGVENTLHDDDEGDEGDETGATVTKANLLWEVNRSMGMVKAIGFPLGSLAYLDKHGKMKYKENILSGPSRKQHWTATKIIAAASIAKRVQACERVSAVATAAHKLADDVIVKAKGVEEQVEVIREKALKAVANAAAAALAAAFGGVKEKCTHDICPATVREPEGGKLPLPHADNARYFACRAQCFVARAHAAEIASIKIQMEVAAEVALKNVVANYDALPLAFKALISEGCAYFLGHRDLYRDEEKVEPGGKIKGTFSANSTGWTHIISAATNILGTELSQLGASPNLRPLLTATIAASSTRKSKLVIDSASLVANGLACATASTLLGDRLGNTFEAELEQQREDEKRAIAEAQTMLAAEQSTPTGIDMALAAAPAIEPTPSLTTNAISPVLCAAFANDEAAMLRAACIVITDAVRESGDAPEEVVLILGAALMNDHSLPTIDAALQTLPLKNGFASFIAKTKKRLMAKRYRVHEPVEVNLSKDGGSHNWVAAEVVAVHKVLRVHHWVTFKADGKTLPRPAGLVQVPPPSEEDGNNAGDGIDNEDREVDETQMITASPEQLIKGAAVFVLRKKKLAKAVVQGPSKKQNHWALKFVSDSKVLPKPIDQINIPLVVPTHLAAEMTVFAISGGAYEEVVLVKAAKTDWDVKFVSNGKKERRPAEEIRVTALTQGTAVQAPRNGEEQDATLAEPLPVSVVSSYDVKYTGRRGGGKEQKGVSPMRIRELVQANANMSAIERMDLHQTLLEITKKAAPQAVFYAEAAAEDATDAADAAATATFAAMDVEDLVITAAQLATSASADDAPSGAKAKKAKKCKGQDMVVPKTLKEQAAEIGQELLEDNRVAFHSESQWPPTTMAIYARIEADQDKAVGKANALKLGKAGTGVKTKKGSTVDKKKVYAAQQAAQIDREKEEKKRIKEWEAKREALVKARAKRAAKLSKPSSDTALLLHLVDLIAPRGHTERCRMRDCCKDCCKKWADATIKPEARARGRCQNTCVSGGVCICGGSAVARDVLRRAVLINGTMPPPQKPAPPPTPMQTHKLEVKHAADLWMRAIGAPPLLDSVMTTLRVAATAPVDDMDGMLQKQLKRISTGCLAQQIGDEARQRLDILDQGVVAMPALVRELAPVLHAALRRKTNHHGHYQDSVRRAANHYICTKLHQILRHARAIEASATRPAHCLSPRSGATTKDMTIPAPMEHNSNCPCQLTSDLPAQAVGFGAPAAAPAKAKTSAKMNPRSAASRKKTLHKSTVKIEAARVAKSAASAASVKASSASESAATAAAVEALEAKVGTQSSHDALVGMIAAANCEDVSALSSALKEFLDLDERYGQLCCGSAADPSLKSLLPKTQKAWMKLRDIVKAKASSGEFAKQLAIIAKERRRVAGLEAAAKKREQQQEKKRLAKAKQQENNEAKQKQKAQKSAAKAAKAAKAADTKVAEKYKIESDGDDDDDDDSADDNTGELVDVTAAQLVKGTSVCAMRGGEYEEAVVQGLSKKKERHWTVKFESDGKVLAKALEDIKISQDTAGAPALEAAREEQTALLDGAALAANGAETDVVTEAVVTDELANNTVVTESGVTEAVAVDATSGTTPGPDEGALLDEMSNDWGFRAELLQWVQTEGAAMVVAGE